MPTIFNRGKIKANPGYYAVMGLLLISLGLVISAQSKKYVQAQNSSIPQARKLDELVLILKESQSRKKLLEKQLSDMREQMNNISKGSLPKGMASEQLKKIYESAGLTPVAGEGIIITLQNDNSADSLNNNNGTIQSDDILKILNELKSSGATAIAVNNQRIVTTSEVVTAGNNIVINQTRIFPPYVIKAVGAQNTLSSAMKMRGGIIEYLEVFGIKVGIKAKGNVSVPPYTGSIM